MSTLEFCAPE